MPAQFIADSYVRADDALNRISQQVSSYITTGESAMTTLAQVRDDLSRMDNAFPHGWLETAQFINQQAAANPDDEAWQHMKRRMDKIIADFQAASVRFDGIATAIDGM